MGYIETREINKKKYYYLVKEIRLGKKKKKFRTYLGKGEKTKKELKTLKEKKEKILDKKASTFLISKDYFYSLISPDTEEKLKKIKENYQSNLNKLLKKDDYYEWFITKFTYDTNAIEGSTLSEIETGAILFEGMVPKSRSLREVHEAENHKNSFDYMLSYKEDIRTTFILKLHELLMHNIMPENAGKIRGVQVYVRGAKFMPPPPQEVDERLTKLLSWYKKNKNKYHPVIVAAYFHTEFEEIHPFVDGNGRIGRLLMNFILINKQFPPVNIKNTQKIEYYETLEKAHQGDLRGFVDLLTNYLLQTK